VIDEVATDFMEVALAELGWGLLGEAPEGLTGQTVVYNKIVSVVREPILAGQFVTVGAQLVIVYTVVLCTVEVVMSWLEVDEVVGAPWEMMEVPPRPDEVDETTVEELPNVGVGEIIVVEDDVDKEPVEVL